jgi:hypothetical protein
VRFEHGTNVPEADAMAIAPRRQGMQFFALSIQGDQVSILTIVSHITSAVKIQFSAF